MEIEQTARPLETNAHANIQMVDNAAYQCMENCGGKLAHIDRLVAHCVCRVQCWDKVKDLDEFLENILNVFSVLFVTQTLSNWYHQWGQLTHFYHTIVRRGPLSLFSQLHVVRFTCGREKNMGMYGYTKWTCSQSLTVLERTISDLQA